MNKRLLVCNIGDLITLAPLAAERRLTKIKEPDLGRMRHAWLLIEGGKVASFGSMSSPLPSAEVIVDAKGTLVLPGLVDCHTHPLFAGSRTHEFCQRLDGKTYQEIAAAGGGILYTVKMTRQASDEQLIHLAKMTLKGMLRHGVTCLEVKTGYALSVDEELRHIRLLQTLRHEVPQALSLTSLALHAVPPEASSKQDFVATMTDQLLPQLVGQVDFVDAFVEKGYFLPEDLGDFFNRAQKLGLKVRIHADEFADSNAAEAAAKWGALSADHLEFASDAGIEAMAKSGVVAVLLPGTSLYSKLPYTHAPRFVTRDCPVALATDFNPGSCLIDNLPMIATLGALHCQMTPAETMAAVTFVAAASLGLSHRKGSLASGYDADFCLLPVSDFETWLASMGRFPPTQVYIGGKAQV